MVDLSFEAHAVCRAACETALEVLPCAAFVTSPRGDLLHANALGRALIARDRTMAQRIAAVAAGRVSDPELVVRFFGPHDAYALVLEAPDAAGSADVARAWGLTARQAEVLRYVVEGWSNKAIASRLGCAVRTVEVHVTALLAKTGSDNRAALVARFWTRRAA